jgi:hypothetical protein
MLDKITQGITDEVKNQFRLSSEVLEKSFEDTKNEFDKLIDKLDYSDPDSLKLIIKQMNEVNFSMLKLLLDVQIKVVNHSIAWNVKHPPVSASKIMDIFNQFGSEINANTVSINKINDRLLKGKGSTDPLTSIT